MQVGFVMLGCNTTGVPVSWACFTFVSLHFVFDSMKSGGVLVNHASWWPDGYQSMTLCLRTVGPADWSPEEARSETRRSGDETSAGAAAALRAHPFLYICYDDYIVVGPLSLPQYNKRRKFSTLA